MEESVYTQDVKLTFGNKREMEMISTFVLSFSLYDHWEWRMNNNEEWREESYEYKHNSSI